MGKNQEGHWETSDQPSDCFYYKEMMVDWALPHQSVQKSDQ